MGKRVLTEEDCDGKMRKFGLEKRSGKLGSKRGGEGGNRKLPRIISGTK
jgi:hypothetical protein